MMMFWQNGDPPKYGYYLAAWRNGDSFVTSELWFNPDSVGSKWWWTRGYSPIRRTGTMLDSVQYEIVAWMPIPEFKVEAIAS